MNNKKFLVLTTLAVACLTPLAFASTSLTQPCMVLKPFPCLSTMPASGMATTVPRKKLEIINYPLANDHPYYAKVGLSLYKLRLPGLNLPLTSNGGATPTPSGGDEEPINFSNVTNSKTAVMPEFEFGYKLPENDSFFGFPVDETSVALRFSFQNLKTQNGVFENGMSLWGLDGNDPLNGTTGGAGTYGDTLHLKTEISLYDLGLLYKGKVRDGAVTYQPYTGLFYSRLKQDNNFGIKFQAANVNNAPDFLSQNEQNVVTNYIGIGGGEKIGVKVNENFDVFANGLLQLLYARSSADAALQIYNPDGSIPVPGAFSDPHQTAHATLNKFTYRGTLSIGLTYYVKGMSDSSSPTVSLSTGMEQWGFLPQIVNKNSTTSSFHLSGQPKLSLFDNLSVNIPIS